MNSLWQHVEAREGQPVEGLDHIDHLEWELLTLSHTKGTTNFTPMPTEPYGEVVCQHMDTLCTAQRETNLTNSPLQDIVIFNDHDSTKWEEWLTDIETAVDLTSESLAKFAKAKSRGLTCMLVTEVINFWEKRDEIKDLLRLKLCNANIHTYTLCFMDIQQQEKESLAAYIHQFKMETKGCSSTNDTATIRIFVEGTHTV